MSRRGSFPYQEFDDLPEGPTMPIKIKEALDNLPESMWDEVDKAAKEIMATPSRPANSFTRAEFQQRHGLHEGKAKKILSKMCADGVIKRYGAANNIYYQLVKK